MSKPQSPVMRYHGGKFRLADTIIQAFPPHSGYVEPFGGAASVLMTKTRCSGFEVYNDLDDQVATVFRVLRDPAQAAELKRRLELTPYARTEFRAAYEDTDDPIEIARRTLVRATMGFGSAGATKGKTGFRSDTVRPNNPQKLWAEYPTLIEGFTQRLRGVLVESRDAIQVMQAHDGPSVLHYVDPPYLLSTRMMEGSSRYYRHEMTDAQHVELLQVLKSLMGYVVLSGYASDLYESHLQGWTCSVHVARASARRGIAMREECLWLNPACKAASQQLPLAWGVSHG